MEEGLKMYKIKTTYDNKNFPKFAETPEEVINIIDKELIVGFFEMRSLKKWFTKKDGSIFEGRQFIVECEG